MTATAKKRASAKPGASRAAAKKASKPEASKPQAKKTAAKAVKAKPDPLDLAGFPPEAVSQHTRWLCLACILDIFTRHLGMSDQKAQTEIKNHALTVDELTAASLGRPYFTPAASGACPHCGAPEKWHAPLRIVRIESGTVTDAKRRALVKDLPVAKGEFQLLEEKAKQRDAFFEWLGKTSALLDLDSPGWLMEAAAHWLARRYPKENWADPISRAYGMRRSRRLDEGWEFDQGRLFVAPHVFDEVLLIQYLLSRSHKSGGLTFEGRLTLHDLFLRLRGGGYLRRLGVTAHNSSDALEQLLDILGGGETGMKYYYIVDRRPFLEKLAALRGARVPKPKRAAVPAP
ncbi:MAG: hypothetical protein U0Q16_14405 [Bryobacteraceae bacterium]